LLLKINEISLNLLGWCVHIKGARRYLTNFTLKINSPFSTTKMSSLPEDTVPECCRTGVAKDNDVPGLQTVERFNVCDQHPLVNKKHEHIILQLIKQISTKTQVVF
jgi:hypothetical protein